MLAIQVVGMPHGQDLDDRPKEPQTYECLQCGTIVEAGSHPGTCECGGSFQDRAKSLE